MSVATVDTILGLDADERDRITAALARHLPEGLRPVFDAHTLCSHLLYDEFIHRLTLRVWTEGGLAAATTEFGTVAEIVARAGLSPDAATVPVAAMLGHLAGRGVVEREPGPDTPRFRGAGPEPLDPAPVRAEQERHDPGCLPSYALAEAVAREYPAFLRGQRSGEEILLAPNRLPLWTAYFSNDNRLYALNNHVGAFALEAWLPRPDATILELGGGCGSGTTLALARLDAAGRLGALRAYRFTELVPAFLRRAQRAVERFAVPGLTFGALDMNKRFGEQGVQAGSVGLVYAVNALHVAHDLAFTLGEVRRALEPGGVVVLSECVRPFPGQTLYPEFVFNLMETFRAPRLDPDYRSNGGFLTIAEWRRALEVAGFADVRVLPDITRLREVLPTFYAAAIGAARGD